MTEPDSNPSSAPVPSAGTHRRAQPSGRISGTLLALGAAAVITVYAAGFERTRSAAEQFDDEGSTGRRPMPMPSARAATPAVTTTDDIETPTLVEPSTDGASVVSTASAPEAPTSTAVGAAMTAETSVQPALGATSKQLASNATAPSKTTPGAVPGASAKTAPVAPSEATSNTKPAAKPAAKLAAMPAAGELVATIPDTQSSTAPATATPAAAPTTVSAAASATASPPANAAAATSTAATDQAGADTSIVLPQWHDGTFVGLGRSRHGNIEATVVVENGRITSAVISRCLTRYSCSWINHLQKQVVDRQRPDVDHVSGATQSADAFFYAVIEALKQAQ